MISVSIYIKLPMALWLIKNLLSLKGYMQSEDLTHGERKQTSGYRGVGLCVQSKGGATGGVDC